MKNVLFVISLIFILVMIVIFIPSKLQIKFKESTYIIDSTATSTSKSTSIATSTSSLDSQIITSTIDGITYQFTLPNSFTKAETENKTEWYNNQNTDYESSITVGVLENIQSEADLVKKQKKEYSYHRELPNLNFSSSAWNVLKEYQYDNNFIAEVKLYGEGGEGKTTYILYLTPNGLPGKVITVSYVIHNEIFQSSVQYFENKLTFAKIVESFHIIDSI